jgi:hypothetical protein
MSFLSHEKIPIIGILFIVAIPSLVSNTAIRMVALPFAFGSALVLALAGWTKYQANLEQRCVQDRRDRITEMDSLVQPVATHLSSATQTIPVVAAQLQEVMQQTGKAALDLGENFMGIIGRARTQALNASEAQLAASGLGKLYAMESERTVFKMRFWQ